MLVKFIIIKINLKRSIIDNYTSLFLNRESNNFIYTINIRIIYFVCLVPTLIEQLGTLVKCSFELYD